MPERVLALSNQVSSIATGRVSEIRKVTSLLKVLGINASIEAGRAHNAAFGIVADEVGSVSKNLDQATQKLIEELDSKTAELNTLGESLVARIRGSRLADLALNMIDIIDRNLYERSCDVRWWATDAAIVECASDPNTKNRDWAAQRLSVILDSYTVYLDLWIATADGRVVANGRGKQYPVASVNVAGESWFKQAMQTKSGADFIASDIAAIPALHNQAVATYATAIREKGTADGRVIGVLGIFFDWSKQSQAVVDSVRLSEAERKTTTCMIVNADFKVIATTYLAALYQPFPLKTEKQNIGSYRDEEGKLIGFALTPGYETYQGLGWYGVLSQIGSSNAK